MPCHYDRHHVCHLSRVCHILNVRLVYNTTMSRMPRRQVSVRSNVTRVIGYVRVSTAGQAESGAGLDAQRSTIEAECQRRGWELVEIVEDALSAKSLNRPGLTGALDALNTGQADVLLCAKLDRLSRSVKDFCEILDMSRHYRWQVVVLDCNVDTSTPAGEMMAGVMAQFAQFERRMIGLRTREALAVKKSQGVQLGRPSVLPAQVVELIGEHRRSGLSYARIAQQLNDQGVPTAHGGKQWHASTVQKVMQGAA